MKRRYVLIAGAGLGGGVAATRVAGSPQRRLRLRRTTRIWRLSARNGGRWVYAKTRVAATRDEARKAELNKRFAIQSSEDVARELGQMKGAMMKAGQLVSFIMETLPDEAQQALSSLQADAPPMAPALAAAVVEQELGGRPEKVFLDWNPTPIAAASVGQVHRAVLRDGRIVAVKVQYPGVGEAIGADLDNVQALYAIFGAFALKGLDTKALVDELRARMGEELDYRIEARNQTEFVDHYAEHPFIRIPAVIPEYSTGRVLTTEWVDGLSWADFVAQASVSARQRAGEMLWRFAQGSVHRLGAFNGDPHPGNYRFAPDGSVTFLDFGLVKRWTGDEWTRLAPSLDAILARDLPGLVAIMEQLGFIQPHHGLSAERVFEYVSAPYVPYLDETFTFTRDFVRETLGKMLDVKGPLADVIEQLNMPTSFVILDRVVWGVSSLLGKLDCSGPWRAMLMEYRADGPPMTELGRADAAWWNARH